MVSSLNNEVSARDQGYQMVQYISTRLQATGATTATKKIGKIPAGAIITEINSKIVTPFTAAAGAATVTIGQLGDSGLDNLVSAINEATALSESLLPQTNITMPLTADTEFWASVAGTATVGDAYLTISFIKPVA